jgi:hypothetical protein
MPSILSQRERKKSGKQGEALVKKASISEGIIDLII